MAARVACVIRAGLGRQDFLPPVSPTLHATLEQFSVVLHPICDLKTPLFRRLCAANARNSVAIALLCVLIRRKIHRFY